MANSLKAVLPALAPILGETADSLYSHQRAFVAAGLLESAPGRGPGSGVPGTPGTIAGFLICMLTNANIAENAPYARSIAQAVPRGAIDSLTRTTAFKDALTIILSDEKLSARVSEIKVSMNGAYARILYDSSQGQSVALASGKPVKMTRGPKESEFWGKTIKEGWRVEITLNADMVRELSKVVLALRRW
jgi:hypothetical protein